MLEAVLASFASPTSYSNYFFSSSSSPFSAAGAGRETSRKNPTSTAAALVAEGLELVEAGLERPEPVDVSGSREGGPSSESERNSVDRLLSGTTNDSDDFADFDLDSSGSGGGEAARNSKMGNLMAVAAFWVSHTSSVYATKALLSRPGRTTRGIVLITWCQCVASFFLVLALGTLGERQEKTKGPGGACSLRKCPGSADERFAGGLELREPSRRERGRRGGPTTTSGMANPTLTLTQTPLPQLPAWSQFMAREPKRGQGTKGQKGRGAG
ncbi:unnamed protein product [Ascophyllum nodosum]